MSVKSAVSAQSSTGGPAPTPSSVSTTAAPSTVASFNTATTPTTRAVSAPLPATGAATVNAVLTSFAAPLLALGSPGGPVQSSALWVLAAAARREFGQGSAASRAASIPADLTFTSLTTDPDASARAAAAAAAAPSNQPPVVEPDPDLGTPDPTTGAVTGQVVASDPEGKKLTYTLTKGLAPGQGTLVFNKTTATFTYTPTAAQRVQAGLTDVIETVQFEVTVSTASRPTTRSPPSRCPSAQPKSATSTRCPPV